MSKNEELYLGDFTTALDFIPDGTVDAFITDPPYPFEFIDCWYELGIFAEKKLKPGGWLVAYSGQKYLPDVLSRLAKSDLEYYWAICLYHKGSPQSIWHMDLAIKWKPILIYYKQPKKLAKLPRINQLDYIVSAKREKQHHEWQQSISSVNELLRIFTNENDLIVDPFAGGGTTHIASRNLKRRCISAEIDEETYLVAKDRIEKNNLSTKHSYFEVDY